LLIVAVVVIVLIIATTKMKITSKSSSAFLLLQQRALMSNMTDILTVTIFFSLSFNPFFYSFIDSGIIDSSIACQHQLRPNFRYCNRKRNRIYNMC
jgi:hypothetical protein